MKKILQFLRASEWYDSKIPMMLAIPLYFIVLSPSGMESLHIVLVLSTFFIFSFAYLSFGYVVNDACDIEIDQKAGKQKLISNIPKLFVGIIIASLIFFGILPLYWFSKFNWRILIILLLNYLLGASYSLKPFRFKERGVTGLVISSAAQRCFPLLILPQLLEVNALLFKGWFALSFISGLRYILIHQHIDYQADLNGGVNTFATKHHEILSKSVYICFVAEIILLLILLIPLGISHPWLISVLLLYAMLAYLAFYAVRKLMHQSFFLGFTYVPLEDLFNVVLPLTFAAQFVISTKSIWAVLTLTALMFYLHQTIYLKGALIILPVRVKFFGWKSNNKEGEQHF